MLINAAVCEQYQGPEGSPGQAALHVLTGSLYG